MTANNNQSKRFQLNKADLLKWGQNSIVFLGPTLLVLLSSFVKLIPQDASWGVIALYLINVLTDILTKFLEGKQ